MDIVCKMKEQKSKQIREKEAIDNYRSKSSKHTSYMSKRMNGTGTRAQQFDIGLANTNFSN
jgi:hypothetical protein